MKKKSLTDLLNDLYKVNQELENIDEIASRKADEIFSQEWKAEVNSRIEDALNAIF